MITGALFSSEANQPAFESSPEAYRLQARDFEAKAEDVLRARATAAETSRWV